MNPRPTGTKALLRSQAILAIPMRPDLLGQSHSAVPRHPLVCHPLPANWVAKAVATIANSSSRISVPASRGSGRCRSRYRCMLRRGTPSVSSVFQTTSVCSLSFAITRQIVASSAYSRLRSGSSCRSAISSHSNARLRHSLANIFVICTPRTTQYASYPSENKMIANLFPTASPPKFVLRIITHWPI